MKKKDKQNQDWDDLNEDKWVVKTDREYILVIVMKLQRLKKITGKLPSEFPEGFQFKIHAYNSVNGNEFVRIDNHENKPPHYHVDKKQTFFAWVSWEESKKLFYQLACQRFGNFPWNIN